MAVDMNPPFAKDIDFTKWSFVKYCACGGTPKYKYRYKDYELHVLSALNTFRVFNSGKTVVSGKLVNMKIELEKL